MYRRSHAMTGIWLVLIATSEGAVVGFLSANAGGPEAYDIFPYAALATLHIPLKFLEARGKLRDVGEPLSFDKALLCFL